MGKLIIISGPSGVGKDTIVNEYKKNHDIYYSVSYTSRNKRPNEIDKKDYNFVTKEEFEKLIKEDFFLEYSKYNDNYYGTPKDILDKVKTQNVFMILETKGALYMKEKIKESVLIFILPPNIDELKNRLIKRNDKKEDIEKRLEIALKELEIKDKYDYVIVNDNIDNTINELNKIVNKY